MECANPSYIKYGRIYHWTNPYDQKGQSIFPAQKLDCRHCIHCRKNRGSELAHSVVLESSLYTNNHFITLTKNPEYEKEHPRYEKREIKNFIRKLQRWCKKKNGVSPKIYRVHEHGKYGRSHYHLIVFNLMLHDLTDTPRLDTQHSNTIEKLWGHGHITVQDVNHATAMYQSLYLDKDLKNGHANSSKKSVSQHSGIGTTAFLQNYKQWLQLGYIPFGDKKQKIPRRFTKIAQKQIDVHTLTNEQYCWKYSKEHCRKVIMGETTKLCTINIIPNRELAELYQQYKNKPRNEEKNNERMKQIEDYLWNGKKQLPDFVTSGQNTLHNQLNRIEKDKI